MNRPTQNRQTPERVTIRIATTRIEAHGPNAVRELADVTHALVRLGRGLLVVVAAALLLAFVVLMVQGVPWTP